MNHDIYKVTPPPVYEHNDATAENNSGKGRLYVVPGDVIGWSWGAFFWGLIWALFHRVYVIFWVLLPVSALLLQARFGRELTEAQAAGRMFLLLLCAISVQFILGRKGREWAWQNRRWDGVAHFKLVQSRWNLSGIIVFVPLISVITWFYASSAWENFSDQQQLRVHLKAGYAAAETVSLFIEQQHRIPGSFAEAGVKKTFPGLVLDTSTARIRINTLRGAMRGSRITLVPTLDVAGFVSWRCLADVPIRRYLHEECPYESSEDARIFPARIQTANAVRFSDQVTRSVGRYINRFNRLPATIADAGIDSPLPEEVSALTIHPGDGNIAVTMKTGPMQGKAYLLVPLRDKNGNIVWQCLAHQIDWHYMPPHCRYLANPDYHAPVK